MLKVLSDAERIVLYNSSLRILDEVGIRLYNKKVCQMVLEAGGRPDKKDPCHVFIPGDMVKKYLALCPREFTLKDRSGAVTVVKRGSAPLHYTSNGIQYQRGTGRKVTEIGENEFVDFVRVVNKLNNVDGIVGTSIKDYPPKFRDFAGFRLMAQYSPKHLRPCIYTAAGSEAIIEMADVILEGKPLRDNMFFTLGFSIVSPLTWSETALELFYRTRGLGIPMMINSEPMAGGTSPVTLAGSLLMADAGILGGIVINQILEPGRPCIYNAGFAHVFDMRTMQVLAGAPENALLQAAGAEMAGFYGLPCASWALSDSLMCDSQASYEKLMTLFAHELSGVNFIWGVGNNETSKTISPELAVIDDELIGSCRRFTEGLRIDERQLSVDFIRQAINDGIGGNAGIRSHGRENAASMEKKAENAVSRILGGKCDIYLSGSQMDKLIKIQNKWMRRCI